MANTLSEELNNIIEDLAPARRVQVTNKHEPYMTDEIRDRMTEVDNLLTKAINSGQKDDWRLHSSQRNLLYKDIKRAKDDFITRQLIDPKLGWRNIRKFNGLDKAVTPSKISHNSQIITSPIKIADITNNFFVDKVTKLNNVMSNEERDLLAVFNRLIPRKQHNPFKLRYISKDNVTVILFL